MKTHPFKIRGALAIVALGLALASAETGQLNATAAIRFKGSSTLHDFEGAVKTQPFLATFHENPTNGLITVTAIAALKVADMTTDHKKRDKNMLKMLDQPRFATISGTLTNAALPVSGKSAAVLNLKIRGIEKKISVTLSDWKREGDQASCHMAFPVSLKAFHLKAPSVIGLIRVGDTVNIECEIKGTVQ